jgi:hypothetical protein
MLWAVLGLVFILLLVFLRVFRWAIACIVFNILAIIAIFVGQGEYNSDMLTIFGAVLFCTSGYFYSKVEEAE